jgi:hypothetical protein
VPLGAFACHINKLLIRRYSVRRLVLASPDAGPADLAWLEVFAVLWAPGLRRLSIEPDRMKIFGDRRVQSQRIRVVLGGRARPAKSSEHESSGV